MKLQSGKILYFVSVDSGKLTKHTIKERTVFRHGRRTSGVNVVIFITGFTIGMYLDELDFVINPRPARYFFSNLKPRNKKCFLVFTNEKLAQKALVNYVLPNIKTSILEDGDSIIQKYHAICDKVQKFEERIQEETLKLSKL